MVVYSNQGYFGSIYPNILVNNFSNLPIVKIDKTPLQFFFTSIGPAAIARAANVIFSKFVNYLGDPFKR